MRKIQLTSLIMSILSSVCILSVGFSSWYEVQVPVKGSGSFETYDALTIEIDTDTNGKSKIEAFQFSALSFKEIVYDGDDLTTFTDSDTGIIKVTYKVPGASVYATQGSFTLTADLGYENLAVANHQLFGTAFSSANKKPTGSNDLSVTVNGTAVSTSIVQVKDGNNAVIGDKISFTKEFSGITHGSSAAATDDFVIEVIYTFTIPSASTNFRNTFGKYLLGADGDKNPTRFLPSAHIED